MGIGEIARRLFAKFVLQVTGTTTTVAYGNLNLCAGLGTGIEVAVHATLVDYGNSWRKPTVSV